MSNFESNAGRPGPTPIDPIAEERLMQGLLDGGLTPVDLGVALTRLEEDPAFRERLVDLVVVRALLPVMMSQVTAKPKDAACVAARECFDSYRLGTAEPSMVARLSAHLESCGVCRVAYETKDVEAAIAEVHARFPSVAEPSPVAGAHSAIAESAPPAKPAASDPRRRYVAGFAVGVAFAAMCAFLLSLRDEAAPSPAEAPRAEARSSPTIAWDSADSRFFASATAIHRIFSRWDAKVSDPIAEILDQIANEPDPAQRSLLYWQIARLPGGETEALAWPLVAAEAGSGVARAGAYSILPMEVTDADAVVSALEFEWQAGERQMFSNLLTRLPSVAQQVPEAYFAELFDRIFAPANGVPEDMLVNNAVTLYYGKRNTAAICERLAGVADTHASAKVRSTADFLLAGRAHEIGDVAGINLRLHRLIPGLLSEELPLRTHAEVAIARYADPNQFPSLLATMGGLSAAVRSKAEELLQAKMLAVSGAASRPE